VKYGVVSKVGKLKKVCNGYKKAEAGRSLARTMISNMQQLRIRAIGVVE
jgi:hypothetical protein